MDDLKRFIREIHRRSIWKVLGVYAVASWGALEFVDFLVDAAGLPGWFPTFALALLVVGLPVVLATAIVQEGGGLPGAGEGAQPRPDEEPWEGPARTLRKGPPASGSIAHRLFTWRNATLGGVGAFALWGLVAAGILLVGPPRTDADADLLRHVAVLPFQSLSEDPENDWFAQGVHDDILTQLSKIGDLRVISRTSVLQYAGTSLPVRQIARELGVGAILEGTVQRSGTQVKVTAQLIDGTTDTHLWADNYTREAEDLFALQAEVALEVARALRASLLPEEEARIDRRPTESMDAWQLYQQAEVTSERYLNPDDAREGVRLFQAATESDPQFAEAWAGLARATVWMHWNFTRDPVDLEAAHRALDRAIELDPDGAPTHAARGFVAYYGHRDFEEALEHFENALRVRPSYADAQARIGYILRRLGRWDAGVEALRRAQELDPRGAELASGYGEALSFVGRYEDALRFFDLAITIQPSVVSFHRRKLLSLLRGQADTVAARRMIETLPAEAAPWIHDAMAAEVAVWRRDWEGALEHRFEGNPAFHPEAFAVLKLGDRDRTARAAERLAPPGVDLDGPPGVVVGSGGDDRTSALRTGAWIHLLRGNREQARAWARAALDALPVEEDAYSGIYGVYAGAMIRALAGDEEGALDLVEILLREPSIFSPAGVRLDPGFEPLRNHPRFRALVGRG